MKGERVLLYQLRGTEAAKKLQPVLLQMGIRIKCVEPEEYGLPIGVLAGVEKAPEESQKFPAPTDSEVLPAENEASSAENEALPTENEAFPVDNEASSVEISAPMMVMCGFSGSRVDAFLQQMRRAGVPRIALKAMLTPTNCYWTSRELFRELQKEHEMMQSLKKPK